MSWCNSLRRAGSDYCVNDNVPGSFVDFRIQFLLKKELVPMLIHVLKSSAVRCLSNVVAKMPEHSFDPAVSEWYL